MGCHLIRKRVIIKDSVKSSLEVCELIAQFAYDKKAEDILILDMRNIVNFCDYFVICSGNTDRHAGAIADNIEDEMSKLGMKNNFKQGKAKSDWVIFDAGDVIAHVFEKRVREFYNLEYLWKDAIVIPCDKLK